MAPHEALGPSVPAGEFHEAATGRIAIHSARSRPGRWILLWPISLGNSIITKVSGNDIEDNLSHSVMIQREWSRKEPSSFPLWRQKERDDVSERKRTIERTIKTSAGSNTTPGRVSHRGNVTPASSGRVDGPAACTARRGPDGVRGVVDFCDPAKIYDIPGLPTGDIPSRRQPAGRETGDSPSQHVTGLRLFEKCKALIPNHLSAANGSRYLRKKAVDNDRLLCSLRGSNPRHPD